jgi:hypothetical protein
MRRRRNDLEYPGADVPAVTEVEVLDDLMRVVAMIDICASVLVQMPVC